MRFCQDKGAFYVETVFWGESLLSQNCRKVSISKSGNPIVVDLYDKICYYIVIMRLNKQQIEHLAFSVIKGLLKEESIIVDDREKLFLEIQELVSKELEKEDLLDEKVKEILKEKLNEIRNSNIDYYEMFKMVKSKLAEKENIVL